MSALYMEIAKYRTLSRNKLYCPVLGIAEGNCKKRLYNHRQSYKDKRHKNDTASSPPRWSSPCRGEGAYPPRSSRVRQRGELN